MNDAILLSLALDMVALSIVGACADLLPLVAGLFLIVGLSTSGALLCLLSLLFALPSAALDPAMGPPGLHVHLAFGPLPAFFLLLILLSGTAVAAFQIASGPRGNAVRVTALCLAGATLSLLAADGITLTAGAALVFCVHVPDWTTPRSRSVLLIPLLLLFAVCLLTPTGFAPRFDAIRAAPVDTGRATAAAMLTLVTAAWMVRRAIPDRDWTRQALFAGVILPFGLYIVIRLITDLSAQSVQIWWGAALLGVGGWIAVRQAWRAASDAGIDQAVAALARRQGGLMIMGVGLLVIAHAADLPQAQSLALEATMLLTLGGALAATLATLAAETMAASAGTVHLSRLGGLIHVMPYTSAALAAGLLTLSAVPPGIGFAALWLLFQALLAAPRTGMLLDQLPLALTAAAIALSAAIATSASVRIIGIAVLGRPRTPQGAGAQDPGRASRAILLTAAGLSLAAGIIPGPALRLLAGAAVRGVTGASSAAGGGLMMLSTSAASPGYLALPVTALVIFATGCIILPRWPRRESKPAGPWFDGMKPPVGLPFGEPMAQSAGDGFRPALPDLPLPPTPRLPALPRLPELSAMAALWIVLAAFGILMLILAVAGGGE